MKKKHLFLIYIAVGCVVLFGAFWLLRSQWQQGAQNMDVMQAVPLDVLYLCYFEHASILNETVNNPASGWRQFVSPNNRMLQLLQQIRTVSSSNEEAKNLLQTNMVYSVHPQGKNSTAALYAFALPIGCSESDWETLLRNGGMSVATQSYHGTQILSLGRGDTTLHTTLVNRMALCSESLLLLQNAIRHVNSGTSLNDNEQFREALKNSGAYMDVRFFINHRATNALAAAAGSAKWRPYLPYIPYLANWTELDGVVSPQVIHLSGFIYPSFTDNNYLSLLLSQNGGDNTLWAMLPETAAVAFNIGFSDVDRFLNGYKYFLDQQKSLTVYRNNLLALGERMNQNVADFFSSLYVTELGMAYIAGEHSGWLSMIKTDNQRYVLEQLKSIADDQRTPWKTNTKTDNGIYHNPAKGLLSALFGDAFNSKTDDYFTVKDNWIVFGNSLELLVSLHSQSGSLKKHIQSSKAAKYSSNESILSVFICPGAATNVEIISYLHPSLQKRWAMALQNNTFKIAGLQLRPSGDKLYTTLFSVYDTPPKSAAIVQQTTENTERQPVAKPPETVTESKQPEANAATSRPENKPTLKFAVINHNDKATEYLVQYDDNTIALLDDKNNEQWSQKIDGRILDKVYQIDFLQNNKLQMLFITANKTYLIDRKGNTVGMYPLTLPLPAKYISVVDYSKNRDYRVFIGFANKTVRLYDKKGLAVEGWQTFTAKAPLTRSPEFFRVGGRDFIVICDEKNTYILDRKGNERVALKTPVIVKPGTDITPQQQPPALKITTTDGKTVTINMNNGSVM